MGPRHLVKDRAVVYGISQMAKPPKPSKSSTDVLASVFEQRAEHLSKKELKNWTAYTNRDEALIAKLEAPGAKLITGPRGSGKSTLLRTAYFRSQDSEECFAVYVNCGSSLALEPHLHKQADALQIFRQWLLYKIVEGARRACVDLDIEIPNELDLISKKSANVLRILESGSQISKNEYELLSPNWLSERLEEWSLALGRHRCVLLLDDAAHAFSPEQQREFFEVFRVLRSRRVSPKAAVYPGITSYSPNFHVGHEAELLEAWYHPDDPEFIFAMRNIVERRLPPKMRAFLQGKQEIVDLLALASFGLPRGFINMLSQLFGIEEDKSIVQPTRQRAEEAIRDQGESVRMIFKMLSTKLPRYQNFVEMGIKLEGASLEVLRKFNQRQSDSEWKTSIIALKEPIKAPLERILNLLEYAGVIRAGRTVSRGVKGSFQRYSIHSSIIISENTLALGKSFAVTDVIKALSQTNAHAFARTSGTSLLGRNFESECTLNLPNCKKCSAPRASEEQRFCMRCGSELLGASLYEDLLRQPIEVLPLTKHKIEGIKTHTQIRTIQDIILDDEMQSLRRVPKIGPVWSHRIRTLAEEFLGV